MEYFDIWQGIDKLAKSMGVTPSGLAKLSGLNPTTFNKSKRVTIGGRRRWLSGESLNRVLKATNISFLEFMALCGQDEREGNREIPVFKTSRKQITLSENGLPKKNKQCIKFPNVTDRHIFALELVSDSFYPFYRSGDFLIVEPGSDFYKGNRIVLKQEKESFQICEFVSETISGFYLKNLETGVEFFIKKIKISLIGRILWAGEG